MRSASVRMGRRSIACGVTVAALAWAPAQALAADGPVDGLLGSAADTTSDIVDPVQGTVDQAAATVSNAAADLSDPVDQVVDTTTDAVAGVSGAPSDVVDPVSDAVSGTVDAVSDATSGTTDAVAGSAGDAVGGVTDTLGTTTSGLSGSGSPEGVSAGGAPGASATGSSVRERTGSISATAAMGPGGAMSLEGREGSAPASEVGSSQGADDSLAGAVADILRKLLAFTGWGALSWIAVALGLSIVGVAAVYHGRRRPRLSGSASRS